MNNFKPKDEKRKSPEACLGVLSVCLLVCYAVLSIEIITIQKEMCGKIRYLNA